MRLHGGIIVRSQQKSIAKSPNMTKQNDPTKQEIRRYRNNGDELPKRFCHPQILLLFKFLDVDSHCILSGFVTMHPNVPVDEL